MPSFSPLLEQTIHSSLALANSRRHKITTLEHLLHSLTYEPDAVAALLACQSDLERIRAGCLRCLDEQTDLFADAGDFDETVPDSAYQRVIQRAAIHVQSAGTEIVTGARVLVAIFAERESYAAKVLASENLFRYDVVNFLTHGVAKNQNWREDFALVVDELVGDEITLEPHRDPNEKSLSATKKEVVNIRTVITRDKDVLAILTRSLELQLEQEVLRLKHNRPNFKSDGEAKAYDKQLDFLEELAKALGSLAEGIANLGSTSETADAQEVAESAQSLRDKALNFLQDNRKYVVFYCAKMPAMLGSVALFSAAGASMATATPVLMAIFGGDRIIRLLQTGKKA